MTMTIKSSGKFVLAARGLEMRRVAVYVYRCSSGAPLRRKVRFEPKTFVWQNYDPATGTWVSGARDGTATATLYNLDLLAAQQPEMVFCCEGAKDADNVTTLGLVAVTSGNACTWKRHHSEQLQQCGCTLAVVLPDCDQVGQASAVGVARENLSLGLP